MATISRPNSYTANTTIEPSQVNNDFNTIYNDYNGNITNANIAEGASIAQSKLNLTSLSGAITDQGWEPSTDDVTINSTDSTDITGSTVTVTPTNASYFEVNAYFCISGGTASTDQFDCQITVAGVAVESTRLTIPQASGFINIPIHYIGEIAAATETVIKITAKRISGGNSMTVKGGLSGFTYKIWNQ